MSIQNVRDAIKGFLSEAKPQVLCIRGAWGTGKTYTWDYVLEPMAKDGKVAFENYAKVSLFGLNSIQEIKREIFSSTIPVNKVGAEFDIKDVRAVFDKAKSSPVWAKALSIWSDNAMDAAIEAASLMARKQLICIDDLERKGKDLRSVDVLGYISNLRDVRKCSVVLLLNDEQLEDKEEFESYLEKVVDLYLRYEPTSAEIAYIAIPKMESDLIGDLVRKNAMTLGITNVRVIRKLLGLVRAIEPMLLGYSQTVTVSAAGSITLLGWSYLQPDRGPPLDYLKGLSVLSPSKEASDTDLRWRDLMMNYGYTHTNEFDLLLLRGVQNGYFVKEEIDRHAAELHLAEETRRVETELRAIWSDFFYTFTQPKEPFLDRLYECFRQNVGHISLPNLAVIEKQFREAGDPRSKELVDLYIDTKKDVVGAFDISHLYMFGEEHPNPSLVSRLEEAAARQKPQLSVDDRLRALRERGFEREIAADAAAVPVEEYIRVFKSYEGEQLSDIVAGVRQYLNVGGISDDAIRILTKAAKALREIEKESELNAMRARRFGIIQWLERREGTQNPG